MKSLNEWSAEGSVKSAAAATLLYVELQTRNTPLAVFSDFCSARHAAPHVVCLQLTGRGDVTWQGTQRGRYQVASHTGINHRARYLSYLYRRPAAAAAHEATTTADSGHHNEKLDALEHDNDDNDDGRRSALLQVRSSTSMHAQRLQANHIVSHSYIGNTAAAAAVDVIQFLPPVFQRGGESGGGGL